MHVNLLPQSFVRRLALRRQVWRWGIAVALTLLISGGVMAVQYCGVVAARSAQAATAFRSKELHAIQTDTKRLVAEAKAVESTIAELKKARPEDRTLALLGITSTSAHKLSGKVHLRSLTTQIAPVKAAPAAAGAPGQKAAPNATDVQPENDLTLDGNAEDAAAIASFIESLRETAVFTRVDLTATSEASGSSGSQRQFRVDCKF